MRNVNSTPQVISSRAGTHNDALANCRIVWLAQWGSRHPSNAHGPILRTRGGDLPVDRDGNLRHRRSVLRERPRHGSRSPEPEVMVRGRDGCKLTELCGHGAACIGLDLWGSTSRRPSWRRGPRLHGDSETAVSGDPERGLFQAYANPPSSARHLGLASNRGGG